MDTIKRVHRPGSVAGWIRVSLPMGRSRPAQLSWSLPGPLIYSSNWHKLPCDGFGANGIIPENGTCPRGLESPSLLMTVTDCTGIKIRVGSMLDQRLWRWPNIDPVRIQQVLQGFCYSTSTEWTSHLFPHPPHSGSQREVIWITNPWMTTRILLMHTKSSHFLWLWGT